MGSNIELGATDGHRFKAWKVEPTTTPKGCVVIAPEIFGVNDHIRAVAEGFAADGYAVLAPSLFDRSERDYEAGYDDTSIAAGRAIISEISFDETLRDIAACVTWGAQFGKVGLVGYCWGGTIAWLAAAQTDGLACAVSYYGGGIPDHADVKPRVPLMLHFGEQDQRPNLEQARAIAAANPGAEAYFYPAGHGFNCDHRASFDAASAALARERTLAFFARHIG